MGYQNKWVFVGASVKAGKGLLCYGLYSDITITCVNFDSGSTNLVWGTAGSPKILYGDTHASSIIGKEVDKRYYPRGLELADFSNLFTQRKAACAVGCGVCLDLVTCSQCVAGYYLSGGGCIKCFSGCATCSGVSESQCVTCSSGYTFESSSCRSKW